MANKLKTIILVTILGLPKFVLDILSLKFLWDIKANVLGAFAMALVGLAFISHYSVSTIFTPPPSNMPEIKSYEFPFEITYSHDGKIYEKSGAVVLKPETRMLDSGEKEWFWKRTIKKEDANFLYEARGTKIYLDCGYSDYYLKGRLFEDTPGTYVYYYTKHGQYKTMSLEHMEKRFGVKILSTKFSEPLVKDIEFCK